MSDIFVVISFNMHPRRRGMFDVRSGVNLEIIKLVFLVELVCLFVCFIAVRAKG